MVLGIWYLTVEPVLHAAIISKVRSMAFPRERAFGSLLKERRRLLRCVRIAQINITHLSIQLNATGIECLVSFLNIVHVITIGVVVLVVTAFCYRRHSNFLIRKK